MDIYIYYSQFDDRMFADIFILNVFNRFLGCVKLKSVHILSSHQGLFVLLILKNVSSIFTSVSMMVLF